jgi:hypothetical protein
MAPKTTKKPAKKAEKKSPAKAPIKAVAAQKPAPKVTAKPVAAAQIPAKKAVQHPIPVQAPEKDTCCNTGVCCSMASFCPIFQTVSTLQFWVGGLLAFATIFVFDLFWHSNLMEAYRATAPMWKPEPEMNLNLIYLTEALTALVLTAIVQLIGRKDWWGGAVSGALAASPLAISALLAYATMPFPNGFIPTQWAIGYIVEGALVGLVLTVVARSYGKAGCGCGCGCESK